MDNNADIKASKSFVRMLHNKFSCNYNLEITELSTKIDELNSNDNNILIFYLHHDADPFSLNFCFFLQNSKIKKAFGKQHIVLYAWDISDKDEKTELISSFAKHFDNDMVDYLVWNRSVAFGIVSVNNKPFILKKVCTPKDLLSLRDFLLEAAEEKPMTSLNFLKSMEKLMNGDEYTSYEREDHKYLKANISYALYGPPRYTEEEIKEKSLNERTVIEQDMKEQKQAVAEMFRKILEINNMYCKWNGRVVLKIIYICLKMLPTYTPDSDFVPSPVFILRKCKVRNDPSKIACRIIIDTEGRVYKSWSAFIENNRYPPCEIIFPEDGRYLMDDDSNTTVYCSILSPACRLSNKVADGMDITAGVTGALAGGVTLAGSSSFVAGAIPFVAAAAPIALPIAVGVGILSGIYAIARGISSLVDRTKHKQKIDLANSESRAAYLNIVAGTIGAGMFGAASTVSLLAGRGFQLGTGTRFFLYGLSGVNCTIGGLRIGNAVHQAITSKTKPPLVIAQLGASILFFSHSIYNFESIDNIIEKSQNHILSGIEICLRSNQHRRTFNNLFGKSSVISSIRNMENVDEVIEVLTRSNKILNKQGIRFNAVGDKILLNDRPVDLMNFGSVTGSVQKTFSEAFLPIPEHLLPKGRIVEHICNEILSDETCDEITRAYVTEVLNLVDENDEKLLQGMIDNNLFRFFDLFDWIKMQFENNKLFQKLSNRGTSTVYPSVHEINTIVDTVRSEFYSSYANFEYDNNLNDIRKEQRKKGNRRKTKVTCSCCTGYYYEENKNITKSF